MGKTKPTEPDVQERIRAAARDVFTKKGYAAASMREIAEAAGVNKGLIHYYKWDKRKLFMEVFEEAFLAFFKRANAIFESDLPLFGKIEQFVEHYMDLLLKNPHLPVFVISELNQHPEEFVTRFLSHHGRPDPTRLMVQVQLEAQAGRIREVNPFHFFLSLLGMCVFPFLARPLVAGVLRIDDETYMQLLNSRKKEVVDLIIKGLGPS